MEKNSFDPRKHARVPLKGGIRWHSKLGAGTGRIIDASPAGAAFEIQANQADLLGRNVALDLDLQEGLTWIMTKDAEVTHNAPQAEGTCRVGVRFRDNEKE